MVELCVDSIEQDLLFSVGHEMTKGERRGRVRGRLRGGEEWGNRWEHKRRGDANSGRGSDGVQEEISWDQ
jgi:hypothetical protein